jgi:hypothetical protein
MKTKREQAASLRGSPIPVSESEGASSELQGAGFANPAEAVSKEVKLYDLLATHAKAAFDYARQGAWTYAEIHVEFTEEFLEKIRQPQPDSANTVLGE